MGRAVARGRTPEGLRELPYEQRPPQKGTKACKSVKPPLTTCRRENSEPRRKREELALHLRRAELDLGHGARGAGAAV